MGDQGTARRGAARRLLLGLAAFSPVAVLVIAGRHFGWYHENAVAPLLVFLALVTGLLLILVTAVRLNRYDLRQKATEALLRRSDQRVRELTSAAPDGIFVADLDGRYTDVNDAGCRLLGMSRDDIVGKSIVDLIPEADVERWQQSKTRLLAGAVDTSEWTLRRRDGGYVPVEVSTSILSDGRWQAFVRDVSERKRAEAALARAQETHRQLRADLERVTRAAVKVSEAVADLPVADISAVLHTIALQAQALTGAEYVAIGLGTDPDKPFDPWVVLGVSQEVAERIGRHPRPVGTLGDVARDGATVRVADVTRHPDFRGFPPHHPAMTSLLGVPIRYRGRPLGNVYLTNKGSAGFSLQDQRRVEMLAARAAVAIETANLYAGEARQRAWLRNIIDQMPEGVVILDAGGHAVATNRAMLAYAHDDTGARDPWGNAIIFDVRRPDGTRVPFAELPVVQALEHGDSVVGRELALHQTDGRVVPVLANSAPVRDEDGRITGATLVVQDITALKELERLREEWASIVAHDLRQPVGAISLAAEALQRWCDGEEGGKERRALARIRSSADRLTRMIGDLLDASRIEAKRLSVTPETTDLCELTEAVVDSLRPSAGEHELRVAVPAELDASIDADRIRQVLTNLISNAVKYGQPDTPIVIEAAEHDGFVEMTVTNQGAGIPGDELPLLFSRFGRTHDARATGKPGTGLGLYICKGLIEAHGGRIWVDSVPGQLTSFHFLLPKRSPAASASAATEHPAPA